MNVMFSADDMGLSWLINPIAFSYPFHIFIIYIHIPLLLFSYLFIYLLYICMYNIYIYLYFIWMVLLCCRCLLSIFILMQTLSTFLYYTYTSVCVFCSCTVQTIHTDQYFWLNVKINTLHIEWEKYEKTIAATVFSICVCVHIYCIVFYFYPILPCVAHVLTNQRERTLHTSEI